MHVILVDLPIAFWIGSFLADLMYFWRGEIYWFQVAWDAMAAGIAFAILAASTGLVDYLKSVPPQTEARSTAFRHGVLNGVITVLFVVNLWWRTGEGTTAGGEWWVAFGLSFVAVALLGYTGWLGGELVFRHRMGVEPLNMDRGAS